MLENWNIGLKIGIDPVRKLKLSFIPLKTYPFFQHSGIPLFQSDGCLMTVSVKNHHTMQKLHF